MPIRLLVLIPALAGIGVLLGGCGDSGPTKEEEKQAYEDAKKYYGNIGNKAPGAAPGGTSPAGSRPGASVEMEARQKTGGSGGQ